MSTTQDTRCGIICMHVANSSYGGLAAFFAGLRYSDIFGNVVSLSGSVWWQPADEKEPEWLVRQFAAWAKLPPALLFGCRAHRGVSIADCFQPAHARCSNRQRLHRRLHR